MGEGRVCAQGVRTGCWGRDEGRVNVLGGAALLGGSRAS